MNPAEILWLTPLLILPGISLLIVSTSARYADLHNEIHHWLDGQHDAAVIEQAHLIERAVHFRNALVSLYACVLIFVLASLVGALLVLLNAAGESLIFGIALLGIVALAYAASELIRESRVSLDVIKAHVSHRMSIKEKHHD